MTTGIKSTHQQPVTARVSVEPVAPSAVEQVEVVPPAPAAQSTFSTQAPRANTALQGGPATHLPSSGDLYGATPAPGDVGLGTVGGFTYDKLTPVGAKIMQAALHWMQVQDQFPHFPKARMCAQNVDRVLHDAGITRYNDEGVRNLMSHVKATGGTVTAFPTDKAAFIAKLNAFQGGHLPAGTLVAGENKSSSKPGDQHVGFIGNVDPDGTVWIYHNNWYRPENEGGVRKPYMVSDKNLARGFPRQFMATPWIKIQRDATGKIVDVKSLMPQIDDMDPLNPQYGVTLGIPSELAKQL